MIPENTGQGGELGCRGGGARFHTAGTCEGGASPRECGAAGGAMNLLQHDGLNHKSIITPGVGEKQCSTILREFFAEQRTKKNNEKN